MKLFILVNYVSKHLSLKLILNVTLNNSFRILIRISVLGSVRQKYLTPILNELFLVNENMAGTHSIKLHLGWY